MPFVYKKWRGSVRQLDGWTARFHDEVAMKEKYDLLNHQLLKAWGAGSVHNVVLGDAKREELLATLGARNYVFVFDRNDAFKVYKQAKVSGVHQPPRCKRIGLLKPNSDELAGDRPEDIRYAGNFSMYAYKDGRDDRPVKLVLVLGFSSCDDPQNPEYMIRHFAQGILVRDILMKSDPPSFLYAGEFHMTTSRGAVVATPYSNSWVFAKRFLMLKRREWFEESGVPADALDHINIRVSEPYVATAMRYLVRRQLTGRRPSRTRAASSARLRSG